MVVHRLTDLTYPWTPLPLTPLGRASITAPKKAATFSATASALSPTLPTPAWTTAPLSCLKSTLPLRNSEIVAATSSVTVPFFGFGISPLGPKILAIEAKAGIMAGVAMAWSKSMSEPFDSLILSTKSCPPATSAPASLAFSKSNSEAKTAMRVCLPVPWGSTADPRTMWSLRLGSVASFTWSSTVSSNLALASDSASATARSRSTASFFRLKGGGASWVFSVGAWAQNKRR
mmetsp:Transcript_8689/g.29844  ORF Transcript_8689/g.29844 Transcript_8689/m.29844 type:complete len:232 (+) Transcript_8689:3971-4666(+)